jgi:hypothetical protein
VSEDITDSVENKELTAEGNEQVISDGDVCPKCYVISNSDLYTWNCVTWDLSAAKQQLKFQFWSKLKSFDFKFKRQNLAGSDLKPKLPNRA